MIARPLALATRLNRIDRSIPAALVVGTVGGDVLVAASPLVLFGALAGLAVGLAMLRSPQAALVFFVAVVSLLPFGVIPIRLGVQLTLVDGTLSLGLLVTILALLRGRAAPVSSPINGLLVLS